MRFENIKQLENKLREIEKKYDEAVQIEKFEEVLKNYHGEDEIISLLEYRKIIEEQRKKEKTEFKSNIPALDKIITGFRDGELVVVSGPTSQGKTSLCQTLTVHLSNQGANPLWFSYEVSGEDFLSKFGDELPVAFVPKNLIDNQLVWIERKIIEAIVKYKTRVVFIDHLHYLVDMAKIKNSSLEIGAIVRELKKMAIKYNIVIFLIAHTAKVKFEDKVGIEDIRDTSFIGQESDYVLMIWRDREEQSKIDMRKNGVKYTNNAILSVEKNRRSGKLGTIKLAYQHNMFYELTENYEN